MILYKYLNTKRKKVENKIFKTLIKPPSKVLDIGCGTGFFLKRIYENFKDSIKYYGIDLSEEAIMLARKNFKKAK